MKVDSTDCIERCDGIIVDAINQNKPRDTSKIEQLLAEYENYKFPNKTDVHFPFSLNGKRFLNLLTTIIMPMILQITVLRTSYTLLRYLLRAPLLMASQRY